MSQQRREKWARTAAKVIVGLIVLDVILYAAAYQPLGRLVAREQQGFTATRAQWLRQRDSLLRLEKRDAALPVDQKQLHAFLQQHVPSRHDAFSRAAILVQQLTQQSGVDLTGIKYSLDKTRSQPLEPLGLETSVQGPFLSLLSFAHLLETSRDFIVVRSFTFAGGDQGVLGLRVKADLYMAP
ncbi:MAG: hypothetical protein ACRD11_15615 [Terriglobia bacterium]